MEQKVTINPCTAETIYISHPTASYGIFCYNSLGDLFLNSDYGFHAYAWRSFGDDFKKFLAQTNSDYIMGKFETNYRQYANKKMPKHMYDNVEILVGELINYLKTTL